MTTLGEALEQGWVVGIQCERHRAGLQSKRPCLGIHRMHLPSLISAFGPYLKLDELRGKLRCYKCGTENVVLHIRSPEIKNPKAEEGEAGRRQMKPNTGGWYLKQSRDPWFVIICPQCKRRGEFKRSTILAKYGPEMLVTQLHYHVAADAGCALARRGLDKPDLTVPFPCKVHFDIEGLGH